MAKRKGKAKGKSKKSPKKTAEVKTVGEVKAETDEIEQELEDIGIIPPEPEPKGNKVLTPLDTEEDLDEPVKNYKITAAQKEAFIAAGEQAAKKAGQRGKTATQLARQRREKPTVYTKREFLKRWVLLSARLDTSGYVSPEVENQARYELKLMDNANWNPGRNEHGKLVYPKAPVDTKMANLVKAIVAEG